MNTPEISDPFIKSFYDGIGVFVNKNDCYVKYLGDGLMILQEISFKDSIGPATFLKSIRYFTKKMKKIVAECPWPPPQGFRTRVVVGHVDKIEVIDPLDHKRRIPEYVGYAINLAQRLLEIQPGTPLVCHESVLQILGEKKKEFRFKKLDGISERPRGINTADIAGLWNIKL